VSLLLSGTCPQYRVVSQLLWAHEDREVWFSLGENHEKGFGFDQSFP
jgi:hypothetical protein